MAKISIIIRAYNEEKHIGRLLEGIARQKLPEALALEIIVVDSGSTDATVGIASSMGAKVIRIAKDDFSFGRALNYGCAQASGEYLIFASAHVYPLYEDWITELLKPFQNEKIALVYGRQVGAETSKFSEKQLFKQWFPDEDNFNQTHPFCNNANCAIRKQLWEAQAYDESLTGLEDLDWATKISKNGYTIAYSAAAVIVHVHDERPEQIKNRYRREAMAMKQIFPDVHFTFFEFLSHLVRSVFGDCFEAFKMGIFLSEFSGIFLFRYMQFRGTYLGHNLKTPLSSELKTRFYYPNKPSGYRKQFETKRKLIDYST